MKKVILPAFLLIALGFALTRNETSKQRTGVLISAQNTNEKVTICHREGNGSSHAITVSIHAVPAHLAHGDAIGDCTPQSSRPE